MPIHLPMLAELSLARCFDMVRHRFRNQGRESNGQFPSYQSGVGLQLGATPVAMTMGELDDSHCLLESVRSLCPPAAIIDPR